MSELDIANFTYQGKIVGTGAPFSHKIGQGYLTGNSKRWISKEMEGPAAAKLELLAQEFFRVIIPHQPETRIAKNKITHTYYVLSEEVEGYKNLPYKQSEKFINGFFTGLGQVLLTALFLEEIDLKNGNVGLDNNNRVVKIDGDYCFSEFYYLQKNFDITPNALANLPTPKDYYVFNWLDLIVNEKINSSSQIINKDLSNAPQFRDEINQAIVKICLLPDEFIALFVDAYMPAGGERFIHLMTKRRNQLLSSALQNTSFNDYLKKPQALSDSKTLWAHIKGFKAGEHCIISPDKQASLEQAFIQRLTLFSLPDCITPLLPTLVITKSNDRSPLIHSTEQKLTTLLDELAQKIGSTNQHHFKEATEVAQRLLEGLEKAKNLYLTHLNQLEIPINKANSHFEKACKTLINQARPILERDLSWGTYLTNLLKAIANAMIWAASLGQVNRFFKPKEAESLKIIEEAGQSLTAG